MHNPRKRHRGPVQLSLALDYAEVPVHRHLECGLYNACLDLVNSRRWVSFSCRGCDLFGGNAGPSRGPAAVLALPMVARG